MTAVSQAPKAPRRPARADLGHVGRSVLPSLLLSLSLGGSGGAWAEREVTPQAAAAVFKSKVSVGTKRQKGGSATLRRLAPTRPLEIPASPPAKLALPIVPNAQNAQASAENPPRRQRPFVDLAGLGLLIGDYHLTPNLALGTDNRLDDVNTRERALRSEMDAREAQRRGEIRPDPITAWLQTRGQPGLPGIDPGFQVAFAIQRVLQGNIRLPTLLDYQPPPRPLPPEEKR